MVYVREYAALFISTLYEKLVISINVFAFLNNDLPQSAGVVSNDISYGKTDTSIDTVTVS